MKGTTFKRVLPSGTVTWGYSIDAGKDADGKRKRIFKSGFATKKEADDAGRIKLNEKADGNLIVSDPQTFGGFVDVWFKEYGPRRCSAKTLEGYKSHSAYVVKQLGEVRLQELTALALERLFNKLKDAGGFDLKTKKPRPLSAMTIHHVAAVVKVILKKAVKLKMLKSSPMDGVELPAVPHHEARVLESDKVTLYLHSARSYRLYELLMFCAATGCRRGEALAMAWADIDLVHGAARISKSLEQTKDGLRIKSTKTERTRTISLPVSLVTLLQFHQECQEQNRRKFGPDYHTDLDLVFCRPDGSQLKPNSVSSKACMAARDAGLKKGVSMHTLRHSHASQLLSSGMSLATVSKRLGHTDVHTTASIYSHSLPKDDARAAEVWDASFQKTVEVSGKTVEVSSTAKIS